MKIMQIMVFFEMANSFIKDFKQVLTRSRVWRSV